MEGPRLTEERLRCHLDANQVMQERLCAAILPALGPYSRCELRRPKGGPDGGRDIEALFRETTPAWAGIGFRNGGGRDAAARKWASKKFTLDLDRALEVNPSLSTFAFLTNVDLAPNNVVKMKAEAYSRGVSHTDIFHLENLRYALDSAEGLIARLQYLEIPMTNTEQAALVSKYGVELQNAVSERFDRLDRTLQQIRRFIDFQMPIARVDVWIVLKTPTDSATIGNNAVSISFSQFSPFGNGTHFLTVNLADHPDAGSMAIARTYWWSGSKADDASRTKACRDSNMKVLASFCGLMMTDVGGVLTLAKIPAIAFTVKCTAGFETQIESISMFANRYELFKVEVDKPVPVEAPQLPDEVASAITSSWVLIVEDRTVDFFQNPPELPLYKMDPS